MVSQPRVQNLSTKYCASWEIQEPEVRVQLVKSFPHRKKRATEELDTCGESATRAEFVNQVLCKLEGFNW